MSNEETAADCTSKRDDDNTTITPSTPTTFAG